MVVNYGISTMAAMALRNTKSANKAKSSMKAFRASVNKIIQDVESESSIHSSLDSVQAAIKRVRAEATGALTDLQAYSEELNAKGESRELYDSLLREFQEYMEKLDKVQDNMPQISVSSPREPAAMAKERSRAPEGLSQMMILEEEQRIRTEKPLESRIIEERSREIKNLSSSVYGIKDIYVQIGDMVEYQGDQLDNIESSMANAFQDTIETNMHLNESAAREASNWRRLVLLLILAICLVLVIIIYRKL